MVLQLRSTCLILNIYNMTDKQLLDKVDTLTNIKSVNINEVKAKDHVTVIRASCGFENGNNMVFSLETNGNVEKARDRLFDILADHDGTEWVL